MNLPNKITVFRFLLIGVLLVLLWTPGLGAKIVAFCVFLLAGFTDFLDGYYARKLNLVTKFGSLMDPLADKIFISATFIAFVELGYVSAWIAIVVISREFLITGLRLIAAIDGHIISARGSGKHKTVSQLIALGFVLIELILMEWKAASHYAFVIDWINRLYPYFSFLVSMLIYGAVFMTILSGWQYLRDHRNFLAGQS